MSTEKNIRSSLILQQLVFDKVSFERHGKKNQNDIKFQIKTEVGKLAGEELYKVSLAVKADKPEEYTVEIQITGIFVFEEGSGLNKKQKQVLINKNAVAILMPYIRSEMSLITAQPGMDCVVLPPFNINKMLEDE
ncbi:MAG TPA: protein-export chaperone SecB [[Clostridium] spiroforme]|uniref:Protein-export chaperone SecB n=1 Tax=Thomasclavelia spiroformis TaxID=29348 RepID=A0A921KJL8_9FIRM|nr:protein-export chaperone SecB [Thomasclavelia spiroformis]